MKRTLWTIVLLSLSGMGCWAGPVAPYPPSDLIQKITWHWETYTNAAIGSDLWPVTWGPDDGWLLRRFWENGRERRGPGLHVSTEVDERGRLNPVVRL